MHPQQPLMRLGQGPALLPLLGFLGRLAPRTQQVADAGAELAVVDRAQQMVGGAGGERPVDAVAILVRGDDDDRHLAAARVCAKAG